MAITPAGTTLTRQHWRQQQALRALLVRQTVQLWPALDMANIDASWPPLEAALLNTVGNGRTASAALASSYYTTFREAEGVTGIFRPRALMGTAWQEQATVALRVTGPVAAKQLIALGRPDASNVALVRLSGAVSRLALNGGRETLMDAVREDRRALGWARVTAFKPCAFCAMLAGRGPVYTTRETADFQAHDHCACTVEPQFQRGAEWPGRGREFRQLWNEATRGVPSREALAAFRKAYEGRAA